MGLHLQKKETYDDVRRLKKLTLKSVNNGSLKTKKKIEKTDSLPAYHSRITEYCQSTLTWLALVFR